ncbi:MAG: hypothetical protein AAFP88_01775 [Bacteroidota bacterium]
MKILFVAFCVLINETYKTIMSTHSYTLKSLLFLTLLLQTACSTETQSTPKTVVELAAEYEAVIDEALVALDQKAQNTGVIEKELETLKREAKEAEEAAIEAHEKVKSALSNKAVSKALLEKIEAEFPKLKEKLTQSDELRREKVRQINDLPYGPEKYAQKIKIEKMNMEVSRALLNLVEAVKVELAVENT